MQSFKAYAIYGFSGNQYVLVTARCMHECDSELYMCWAMKAYNIIPTIIPSQTAAAVCSHMHKPWSFIECMGYKLIYWPWVGHQVHRTVNSKPV